MYNDESPFEIDSTKAVMIAGGTLWRLVDHGLLSPDAEGLVLRKNLQVLMERIGRAWPDASATLAMAPQGTPEVWN